jgi:hypothetical protein
VFLSTGEDVVAVSELRFRSLEAITDTLMDAGFTVEHVYVDWHKGALVSASRVKVIVARRD